MRRRALLALAGSSLAGLAGCLSGFGTGGTTTTTARTRATDSATTTEATPTRTTADHQTASETATPAASVSVQLDALQPGLVTLNTPDSIAVHPTDGQYLLLDVTAEGQGAPQREEFSFRFAGTEYDPTPTDPSLRAWRFYNDEDATYDAPDGGLLLFELPESGDASDAMLRWPGGEWRPGEALRRRLAGPEPPLSVSAEIPASVAVSERPTITVTVRNEGDLPGRFVAGLNRSGPMVAHTPVERVSLPVPAGETSVRELRDDSILAGDYPEENVGDGEPDMTYYLDWADDRVSRDVRYVQTPGSTTDTA